MQSPSWCLYENLAWGILVFDKQGRLVYYNPAAAEVFELEPGERVTAAVLRRRWRMLDDSGAELASLDQFAAAALCSQPVTFKVVGLCGLGSREVKKWIQLSAAAQVDCSEPVRKFSLLSVIDVTAMRELRAQVGQAQMQLVQAARLATIGEMASGVAHQIYNPLTTIIADAQLLLRQLPDGAAARESAESIVQAGWRLQAVVQHLLAFSRPPQASLEPLALNDTIQRALLLVTEPIEALGITLQYSLAEDLSPVRACARQLEDLWLNLLFSAREAVQGAQSAAIQIRSLPCPTGVRVEVQFNRLPVSTDRFEAIFEPNFIQPIYGRGSGMELSICREIVRQHGGEICALHIGDRDTIFRVELPGERLKSPHDSGNWKIF
jgi:C4-dicarboxylate-specific signal transduction histidine kinase